MKILIKGNLIAKEHITSMMPIEYTFEIINEHDIDEKEFDMVICGDTKIDSLLVVSDDIRIAVTGYISVPAKNI